MMQKQAPKSPTRSPSSGSEDSEEEEMASEKGMTEDSMASQSLDENVLRSRREKRLAMNRASARARRKRKKELLGSLAGQVQELTNQNQTLQSKNDTLSSRIEQLEAALAQAQTTITTLSSGNAASMQSLHQPHAASAAGVGQLSDSALRSLLLGSGLSGASGLGLSSAFGDSLLNARAAQQLELQNQLRLLNATSGFGAAGLGGSGGLHQHAAADRIGALGGVTGLGSFLGGGLGQGMPQLDSLVRARQLGDSQGSGSPDKKIKRGQDEAFSKLLGPAVGTQTQDGSAAKKPRV